MDVKIERKDSELLVSLAGELDQHAARGVMLHFRELEAQTLPERCTLDLSSLRFTDSSGIAVLLGLHRRMSDIGGSLRVVGTPQQAMKVFGAAGLRRVMKFE